MVESLATEEVLEILLDSWHARSATNDDDLIDVVFVNFSILVDVAEEGFASFEERRAYLFKLFTCDV